MLSRGTWRLVAAVGVCAHLATAGCTAAKPSSQRPLGAGRAPAWTTPIGEEPVLARAAGDSTMIVATGSAIVAVDRATGAQRWRVSAASALADTSIAIDDRLVITKDAVVLLGGSMLDTSSSALVLDLATGAQRFAVPGEPDPGTGLAQPEPPVDGIAVTSEMLLVARCRLVCRFEAHDLSTGQIRWTSEVPGDFAVMPVVARRTLFERFEFADGTRAVEPTVVIAGRWPYTAGDPPQNQFRYAVLDARTGQPAGEWASDDDYRTAVIVEGVLIPFGFLCRSPVRATDARTGRRLWEAAAECASVDLIGGVSGSGPNRPPAVVGGQLLIFASGKRPQLVDLATGTVRWTSGSPAAPLGMAGGGVVQRILPDGDVVSADPTGGAERWRFRPPLGGPVNTYWLERSAVVGDAVILCGREFVHEGSPLVLRVLDPGTGRERWYSRDTRLIGAGPGWIMATGAEDRSTTTGGHELRLYRI